MRSDLYKGIRDEFLLLLPDYPRHRMRKVHRDFEALLEEEALMQDLRHRDSANMLRQEIETEQNIGEVFTVGKMPGLQRLDINRPKAFRDALPQDCTNFRPAGPWVKTQHPLPLPPSGVM